MSKKSIALTENLYRYLLDHSLREQDVQRRLREETGEMREANMQIAPEQGQFMQMLVKLIGARRILEVGVFTGYSSLAMALALPADGKLIACDINSEWTAMARRYWEEAGVSEKIELRLGPALETMEVLKREWHAGHFDLVFIDADKENYLSYFEQSLLLVRAGGLLVFDNTLWDGHVVDESCQDAETEAIRALNNQLHQDDRIDLSMLPIGDGLSLVRKR